MLLAALLLASAAAALPGGVGVGKMVVDPTRVAAGTTDNVLRFTFTADTAPLAGQTLVDVAPGWTRPQLQNESGPGYVSLRNVTCGPRTRIASLVGRRIVIATSCPLQGQFVLTYANASAPRFASDGFTFVTQTRPAKSLRVNGRLRFRPLAPRKQPTVIVAGGDPQTLDYTATTITTAGVPFSMLVRALDQYGNTAGGYSGTVTFATTDPQAVIPAPYTFVAADAGAHTFTGIIFRTPGTQSITVTDTGGRSIVAGPINVYPWQTGAGGGGS